MTLEKMRESFLAAEGLGAAAVMVRLPQALALLDCAEALKSILQFCDGGDPCAGDDQEPCRIHEHHAARKALTKLKEAGVTI